MPGEPKAETLMTVVHAPGCHFCEDADAVLTEMASRYPLRVERVDIRSAQGMELVQLHRPTMNPLVLVDGRYFSAGRLPRKKLARLLDQQSADRVKAG